MSEAIYDVSSWGFFRFQGPDVKKFLQGLITADINQLSLGEMLPACVLTPKGLLLADCEFYEEAQNTILAVTRPMAADNFFKVFEKKIMLSDSKFSRVQTKAWLVFGTEEKMGIPWSRLEVPARLILGDNPPDHDHILTPNEFELLRITAGFPIYGVDMDMTTLPLEARQENAISLNKGCYMGQETVSRLARVGHVNRLLVGLQFPTFTAAVGSKLTSKGVEVGTISSVAGTLGIGMVKLPESKKGTALDAEGISVVVREITAWPTPYGYC